MTWLQAMVLALVQGVTELFPVSSLGHAVILPKVLGWNIDQGAEWFLPFLVVMHLGTAVALLLYFWRDWWAFGMAVVFGRGEDPGGERRLFWRVVVATIPAVILGALFEKLLKKYAFGLPEVACVFLMANGAVLFAAERLKRAGDKPLRNLGWVDALIVGLWQCAALIPGISRSGTTMVGGFLCGLDHKDAARFSFLTATPIILGATVLEAPKLLKHGATVVSGPAHIMAMSIAAGVVAGIAAYLSLWAIMRWFKRHEFKAFDPFAFYCLIAGALFLAAIRLGY